MEYYRVVSVAIDLERRLMVSTKGRRGGDKHNSQEESVRTAAQADGVPQAAPKENANEGPNARTLKRRLRYKRALEKAKQATPTQNEPAPRVRINAAKAALLEMKVEKVRSKRRVEVVAESEEVQQAEQTVRYAHDVDEEFGVCAHCDTLPQNIYYTDCPGTGRAAKISKPSSATPVAQPARANVAGPSTTAPVIAVPIWDPSHPRHDPSKVKSAVSKGKSREARPPATRNTKIDKAGRAVHKKTPT